MWTAIRKQWDYCVLTCLLGLYVTAAVAAVIAFDTDAGSDFLTLPPAVVA